MNTLALRFALFGALLLAISVGCGRATTEVTGRVTFQGKALTGGTVTFFCCDKQIAYGLINPAGTYHLKDVPMGPAVVTVRTHPKIPPGYAVRQKLPPSKDAPQPKIVSAAGISDFVPVPERYYHPEESGLSFTVSSSRTVFNIELNP